LSRILRGSSEAVGSMKESVATPGHPAPFEARRFRMMISSDTVTQEELAQKVEEALARGKAMGAAEAEQKLRVPLDQALQNLEGVLDDLGSFRRELFKEVENEVLELLRIIAKRVLSAELSLKPELLSEIIAKAMHAFEEASLIKLDLNPQDQASLSVKPSEKVKISAQTDIPRGRAFIATDRKGLEVSIDQMVDQLLLECTKQNEQIIDPTDDGGSE